MQTALILIGARYIVLMPQTYMAHYFLDTLHMDKVSARLTSRPT